MADLRSEYTDVKNIRHTVKHITSENAKDKEQISKELYDVFKKRKRP